MKLSPGVDQLLEAMYKSITFIVGRNPLERLVSGYRDKIVNAFKGSEHDKLGKVNLEYFTIKENRSRPIASFDTSLLKICYYPSCPPNCSIVYLKHTFGGNNTLMSMKK
jgi:hypothetical protein